VTGLSWSRFGRAAAALFAGLIGVAAIAEAARASPLGNVAVLVAAGLTATAVTFTAVMLRSKLFLGPHGRWARPNRRESCCNRAPTASTVTEAPIPNGVRTEASGWPVLT
jgi:hypothetical protein